jgi:hypothetical protein
MESNLKTISIIEYHILRNVYDVWLDKPYDDDDFNMDV